LYLFICFSAPLEGDDKRTLRILLNDFLLDSRVITHFRFFTSQIVEMSNYNLELIFTLYPSASLKIYRLSRFPISPIRTMSYKYTHPDKLIFSKQLKILHLADIIYTMQSKTIRALPSYNTEIITMLQ
jgi:hypothetical protein